MTGLTGIKLTRGSAHSRCFQPRLRTNHHAAQSLGKKSLESPAETQATIAPDAQVVIIESVGETQAPTAKFNIVLPVPGFVPRALISLTLLPAPLPTSATPPPPLPSPPPPPRADRWVVISPRYAMWVHGSALMSARRNHRLGQVAGSTSSPLAVRS